MCERGLEFFEIFSANPKLEARDDSQIKIFLKLLRIQFPKNYIAYYFIDHCFIGRVVVSATAGHGVSGLIFVSSKSNVHICLSLRGKKA